MSEEEKERFNVTTHAQVSSRELLINTTTNRFNSSIFLLFLLVVTHRSNVRRSLRIANHHRAGGSPEQGRGVEVCRVSPSTTSSSIVSVQNACK